MPHGKSGRNMLTLALTALAMLLFVSPVFADYFDGFDSYAPGTQTPGPWFTTPDNVGCWEPPTTVSNYPGALSPPNTYFVYYTRSGTGCTGINHQFVMGVPVNATGTTLTITALFAFESSLGTLTGLEQIQLVICPGTNEPPGNGCTGTMSPSSFFVSSISSTSCTSNCWAQVSTTATVTPGTEYSAELWVQTSSGISQFQFNVDNVNVKGGSVIVPGANLFLVNYNSKTWWNVTGFPSSRVYVYFPQSAQTVYNNINTPDLLVNTLGSDLLTAWVGNSYARSIIPTQGGKNTVYLDPPSVVLAYTFDVQDFSNTYLPGSEIYVKLDGLTITSGYLDGQDSFTAWLQPANYTINLVNGANSYVTYASLSSSTSNPVPIQIATITHKLPVTQANFNFDAGWDSNLVNIAVFYHDPNVDTTFIEVKVYNQTANGVAVMADDAYLGKWGNFTAIISCSACKFANSQYIYVQLVVTNQYGTKYVFGTQGLGGGSLFTSLPNLPDYGGLFAFLPQSGGFNPWLELIGLALLIAEAGLTGYLESPAGFILITLTLTGEGMAGMIPVPPPIGGALTLFAITAYMTRARDVPPGGQG